MANIIFVSGLDYRPEDLSVLKQTELIKKGYGETADIVSFRYDVKTQKVLEAIEQNQDAKIILIEEFPCESRLELEQREGYWQMNNPCTNIYLAGRDTKQYRKTDEYRKERKLYMRDYRNKNKN